MTGFARVEGEVSGDHWVWELRSVNGRGFDLRCRFPPGYDRLETRIRKLAAGQIKRGQMTASLQLTRAASAAVLTVDETALNRVASYAHGLVDRGLADPPRADGLLALRGVLEMRETASDRDAEAEREQAMIEGFERAITDLVTSRQAEGAKLGAILAEQVEQISALTKQARASAGAQPAAIRARLEGKIEELLPDLQKIPEDRLLQEIAVLAAKADVREELDRLDAHVASARALLSAPEPVGRKLDFLTQEFNREANTLCAKSTEMELTNLGLALKAVIDQIREQAQNVE